MNINRVKFQRTSSGIVGYGEKILFNCVSEVLGNDIAFDKESGKIAFRKVGNYYIKWKVNLDRNCFRDVNYKVALVSSKGDYVESSRDKCSNCIEGYFIMKVTEVSEEIELKNVTTNCNLIYSGMCKVKAELLIIDVTKIKELIGEAGPKGIQGERGLQGSQGMIGPKGETGRQGPQGDSAPRGGATGATGLQGPQGELGEIGPQGIIGLVGEPGPEGARGLKGATGATGPQGPPGATGEKGSSGDIGDRGLKGDTGDMGPKGQAGEKGPEGPFGDEGPIGPQGLQGPKGEVGLPGLPGIRGAHGSRGATGATGPFEETAVSLRVDLNKVIESNSLISYQGIIRRFFQGDSIVFESINRQLITINTIGVYYISLSIYVGNNEDVDMEIVITLRDSKSKETLGIAKSSGVISKNDEYEIILMNGIFDVNVGGTTVEIVNTSNGSIRIDGGTLVLSRISSL